MAYFGIIPVYISDDNDEMRGVNKFCDLLLDLYVFIETKLGTIKK